MTEAIPPPDPVPEDGEIPRWIERKLGKSWKTSACGLLTMAAGFISAFGQAMPGTLPPALVIGATVAVPILTGSGLMLAKDKATTGKQ